ncbi:MAG: hypothetical protein WCF33_20155 [Pseudonocardiaceae bacterium]
MDRFLNITMTIMTQAEAYPPVIRHAGLWFEEIHDISEQTLPKSIIWLSARTDEAQPDTMVKFREEIDDRFDPTDIDIPKFGHLMVVARRPEE